MIERSLQVIAQECWSTLPQLHMFIGYSLFKAVCTLLPLKACQVFGYTPKEVLSCVY